MTVVYIPVYRLAVGYAVTVGRRWSVLEHLILTKLATERLTVSKLAALANLPERLVIESLINLLRAGWIEVRSTDDGVFFSSTGAGKRRATEENLPLELGQRIKWITLCFDRIAGCWMRADDLTLVNDYDLPRDAHVLQWRISTFDPDDDIRRSLVYLEREESFERFIPASRSPSRVYARVDVAFDSINGLPSRAALSLRSAIIDEVEAPSTAELDRPDRTSPSSDWSLTPARDNLSSADFIIGGQAHLDYVKAALARARSHFILHSCFIDPAAIEILLPHFEAAARRKVRIDLLWGLREDPESSQRASPVTASLALLDRLTYNRKFVELSSVSSASHAKAIIFDDKETGDWETLISSCNFLSSYFTSIEVSVRCRSRMLAAQILGRLLAAQMPASGAWSRVVHRLNRTWNEVRPRAAEIGEYELSLLVDDDHYGCIRTARNEAKRNIVIGCDIYGVAADTSVLPPLQRAAERGAKVQMYYQRPSRQLSEKNAPPDPRALQMRGIELRVVKGLHGKFLLWDESALAITSFNWMAASVDGTRSQGAEIGVLVRGPALQALIASKFKEASAGAICFDILPASVNTIPS